MKAYHKGDFYKETRTSEILLREIRLKQAERRLSWLIAKDTLIEYAETFCMIAFSISVCLVSCVIVFILIQRLTN